MLPSIIANVPNYKEDDLRENFYRLYYRTYSEWKIDCQAVYTTKEVQKFGEQIGTIDEGFFSLRGLGISIFAIALFESLIMCL